jgi:hypothetical protein
MGWFLKHQHWLLKNDAGCKAYPQCNSSSLSCTRPLRHSLWHIGVYNKQNIMKTEPFSGIGKRLKLHIIIPALYVIGLLVLSFMKN